MKLRKFNEKGSTTLFLVFVYLFVILAFLFGIIMPLLQTFNVQVFQGGEQIMIQGIASANQIQDTNVRNALLGVFNAEKDAVVTNTQVTGVFVQYAWFMIAGIILLVLFVQARRQVETQSIQ